MAALSVTALHEQVVAIRPDIRAIPSGAMVAIIEAMNAGQTVEQAVESLLLPAGESVVAQVNRTALSSLG